MSRFEGLTKLAEGPAARLLAKANAKIETKLDLPAASDASTVLAALDEKHAHTDILRLLSVALPVREGVWWACLAARDMIPEGTKPLPATLETAEAWVFKPNDETRQQVREAYDAADSDDPATLCAAAVSMSDGTLGPGDLAQYPAAPGISETSIFGMNLIALGEKAEEFDHYIQVLIERAIDIAKGGNGTIDPAAVEPRIAPDEDDEDDDEDEDDLDDDEEDEDDEEEEDMQ
ncbi:MAG: hypothetical protein AAF913_01010 [Pseudomonadota bacterium]